MKHLEGSEVEKKQVSKFWSDLESCPIGNLATIQQIMRGFDQLFRVALH